MAYLPVQNTPPSLYVRGIELGVLPRAVEPVPREQLVRLGRRGPLAYEHAAALLAAADLSDASRVSLEESLLAFARYAASSPLQGAYAYARIVLLLPPDRAAAVRLEGRPVLDRAAATMAQSRPVGGSWLARFRDQCTLLPYRELWQALAPEDYPEWLREQAGRMLQPSFWWAPPELYRENLAQLHLLGADAPRGLALALAGVAEVTDGWATAGGETPLGESSSSHEASSDRRARAEALAAVAPLLPAELHQAAAGVAEALGIELPATLGAHLGDPLAAAGLAWYHTVPEQPIPWLTVPERRDAFAMLDADARAAHVAALVDAAPPLADAFLRNGARSYPNKLLARRWERLVDEDIPVAAPYLDEPQARLLLAIWGLPLVTRPEHSQAPPGRSAGGRKRVKGGPLTS